LLPQFSGQPEQHVEILFLDNPEDGEHATVLTDDWLLTFQRTLLLTSSEWINKSNLVNPEDVIRKFLQKVGN
jgi:hypothetical protein